MEVKTPLPTVEQLTRWMKVGDDAIALAVKLAGDAYDLRQRLAGVYTSVPVGIYLHREVKTAACCDEHGRATPVDLQLVKAALDRAYDLTGIISVADATAGDGDWVKVAYSPVLRGAGEALNFFPGHYPGGIPNHPGPVSSMLTSGLVGAGLGYGAGWAGEQLMPETWRKGRLSKTLALIGGAAGAAPGAIWGGVNKSIGKDFNDASLVFPKQAAAALEKLELGERYKRAAANFAARYATAYDGMMKEAMGDTLVSPRDIEAQPARSAMSVNVDAMGRTLWETGASPQLAGVTMGTLAAAQQMPGGGEEGPGFVTPLQMANLAAHMGAGYLSGAVIGSTLGLLTGLPQETQDRLKQTGMYLGILQTVVPRLFGQ